MLTIPGHSRAAARRQRIAKRPGPGRMRWGLLVASALVVSGCSAGDPQGTGETASPGATEMAPGLATPSAVATPTPMPTPTPSASVAPAIDTGDWKSFTSTGVSFSYPRDWVVEEDVCEECGGADGGTDNPYAVWKVISASGIESLNFAATSAIDTDGDRGTYQRTELERISIPGPLDKPALLVAEHQVITSPGKKAPKHKLVIFVIDQAEYARRTANPELAFFHPAPESWALMHSNDDFIEDSGIDEDQVSLAQAREITTSDEYAIMREIMLSVRAETEK